MQKKILISAVLSVVVILLSLGIISHLSIHDSIMHSLGERLELSEILAKYMDYNLQRHLTRLYDISLSGAVDLQDNDWEPEIRALKTAYQYSIFTDGIFLLDRKGDIILTYPPEQVKKRNLLSISYVKRTLEEEKPVISNIYTEEETKRKVIYVIVPLRDKDGRTIGAVGGEINPTNYFFNNIIRTIPASGDTVIELVDSFGYVIASNSPVRIFACSDRNRVLGNLIASRKKTVMECHRCHEQENGSPVPPNKKTTDMLAFTPLSEAPWGICVREPQKTVFGPSSDLRKRFLILGFISTGTALLFALGMSRSIVNPIKSLIGATNRIAEGNLKEPVTAVSRDEIGTLSRSFETMRARLSESLDSIQKYNTELEKRVDERTYELRQNKQRLAMLLDEVIEAQEEERKRVARELHDEICQLLAALGMSIDIAALAHTENTLSPDGIRELKKKVEQVLVSINLIIRDLRPPILDDLGLESAISWLLEKHLVEKGIDYYLISTDSFKKTMAEFTRHASEKGKRELMIFRVVQEAIINISRHSRARNAFVFLESKNNTVQIGIEDDGIGFNVKTALTAANRDESEGFGILGVKERVDILGGKLNICSGPNTGTSVSVHVPWASLGVKDV